MRIPPFLVAAAILGTAAYAAAQTPPQPWLVGSPEIQVNQTTTGNQMKPAVAIGANHGFVVTWADDALDGNSYGIFARIFDATGQPVSAEFQVNTTTTGKQYDPAVASDSAGNFVVVWSSYVAAGQYTEVFGQRFDPDGDPLGGEFQVNSFTTGYQYLADVARNDSGFVVTWASLPFMLQPPQDGSQGGVYARRYDSGGVAQGGEFLVNTTTTSSQGQPSISMNLLGFAIVWYGNDQDGDSAGVFGQRFDASASPVGSEFQVNTSSTGYQLLPDVALGPNDDIVVSWLGGPGLDGSGAGVFARVFPPPIVGPPSAASPDFQLNTFTTNAQSRPKVLRDRPNMLEGGFIAVWQGFGADDHGSPNQTGVAAQRYHNAPFSTAAFTLTQPPRAGSEHVINTFTTGTQFMPDVAAEPDGRFVVVWESFGQDGDGSGIFARGFGFPSPASLKVDERVSGGTSNVNGVLEAGERVTVDPSWINPFPNPDLVLAGSAANLTGPPGPTYGIDDGAADYGTVASSSQKDCFTASGDCYEVTVSGARPVFHWDAIFDEDLATPALFGGAQDRTKTWGLHVGGSFPDVPQDGFYPFIENLFHNEVTAGGPCGAGLYCGEDSVLRQQMAVFILKGIYGADYVPAHATGAVFDDVPVSSPFAPWIEDLAVREIVGGCTAPPPPALPSYCPTNPVNRQQMAVFLVKALFGAATTPPPCIGVFEDVPCSNNFAPWIELLVSFQITAGCQASPPLYCPTDPVKRKQMAVFLVKTYGLQLYGAD